MIRFAGRNFRAPYWKVSVGRCGITIRVDDTADPELWAEVSFSWNDVDEWHRLTGATSLDGILTVEALPEEMLPPLPEEFDLPSPWGDPLEPPA